MLLGRLILTERPSPPITNGSPAHVERRLRIRSHHWCAHSARSLTRMSSTGTPSISASVTPGSAPCRTSAFDQRVWPGEAITVKKPLNSNYISMSLWGFLLASWTACSDPASQRLDLEYGFHRRSILMPNSTSIAASRGVGSSPGCAQRNSCQCRCLATNQSAATRAVGQLTEPSSQCPIPAIKVSGTA
jgi:hypothetical protein